MATPSRVLTITSIIFFFCATSSLVTWSFLMARCDISKIQPLRAGPKHLIFQRAIGIALFVGSIFIIAYSLFLQQDPSKSLVLSPICTLSGLAPWNEYIYLSVIRYQYPRAAWVALVLIILSSIYKLTVSSIFFRALVSTGIPNRLLLIVFLLNAMEGLFQAAIYCKIAKALVRRAHPKHNLRKAVLLAMIGTTISAILSLVLVFLGSRSEPMWISLTPLYTSALCLIRLCVPTATLRASPTERDGHFETPFDLKKGVLEFKHDGYLDPSFDLEKGMFKVELAEYSSSDIVYPGGNIFELEKGDGIRKPGKGNTVKLRLGVSETSLTPREILKTPSSAFEGNLQTVWVSHNGLPEAIFAVILKMTLGQKIMIVEKADKDRGKGAKIHIIKLQKIMEPDRSRIRVGCCACGVTTGPGKGWECGICEHERCPVCYFLTEWPAFHAAVEPAFHKAFNALLGCIDALRCNDMEPSALLEIVQGIQWQFQSLLEIVQGIQWQFQSLLDILAMPEIYNTDWRGAYIEDLKSVTEYFIPRLTTFLQRYATLDKLADEDAKTLNKFRAEWPEIRDFVLFYQDKIRLSSWKRNGIQRPRDLIRLQSEIKNWLSLWWVQVTPILDGAENKKMCEKERDNLYRLIEQWRLISGGCNLNGFSVIHSLEEGNLEVFVQFNSNFKWKMVEDHCDTHTIQARPGNVSSTASLKYQISCLVVGL